MTVVRAVADGHTDDTLAVQVAFATAAGSDQVVEFPRGVYTVGRVEVPPSIRRIVGRKATLKMRAHSDQWMRLLVVGWDRDEDSPGLLIEGLHFDGNLDQQAWDGGYNLAHQALVFLSGRNQHQAKRGRLNVTIRDCSWQDCAADGVYVHHQVSLEMLRCRGKNCFRGSLIITGDQARVEVTDFEVANDRPNMRGIDVEPNHPQHAVQLKFSNVRLSHGFDLALPVGSVCHVDNLTSGPPLYLANRGICRIANSRFVINQIYKIRLPGDVRFSDCQFVLTRKGDEGKQKEAAGKEQTGAKNAGGANHGDEKHENGEHDAEKQGEKGRTLTGVGIQWARHEFHSNQRAVFRRCQWTTDETIRDEDRVSAIYTSVDKAERNNLLIVRDSKVDGNFDIAFVQHCGGNWLIQNTFINARTPYRPQWKADGDHWFRLTLSGNTLGPRVERYWAIFADHPKNRVTHRNTTLTAEQNRFAASKGMYRFGANHYHGGRTIHGEVDPSEVATPGLLGDIYVAKSRRWRCTRGDYQRATWEPVEE